MSFTNFVVLCVLLGVLIFGSNFFCNCHLSNGVNGIGWSGLYRIASSKLTDLNKDRVLNFCQFTCELVKNVKH